MVHWFIGLAPVMTKSCCFEPEADDQLSQFVQIGFSLPSHLAPSLMEDNLKLSVFLDEALAVGPLPHLHPLPNFGLHVQLVSF